MAEGFFSSTDLLLYVQCLIKESSALERKTKNNYGWLKSKLGTEDFAVLEKYENRTLKLSSESCVTIAIKLDRLTDETNMKPREIRKVFEKLLEEEQNSQLLKNVKKKTNIVYPKVSPEGRRQIVSFISENDLSSICENL